MMPRTLRAEVAPRVVSAPAETVAPPLGRLNLRLRRWVRMAIEHALREGGMRGEGQMLGSRRDSDGANGGGIVARPLSPDRGTTIARHAQVPKNVARA